MYGCLPQENKTLSPVIPRSFRAGALVFATALMLSGALAQDPPQNQQSPQDIPDAPSATRPVQTFPTNLPPARPEAPPEQPAPKGNSDVSGAPPAMPPVNTIPPGSAPAEAMNARDELYTITVSTNLVLVPVTVKDDSGHLVDGLLPRDFSVFEDGHKQSLRFFTSDPFPLSAAIVLDTGMPDVAL